jgi:peptide deformylase
VAVLPIRKFGDPVLRERAREIETITDLHHRLAADMLETMRATGNGVGLAGNQVGVVERIFVWEIGEEHGALINPVITDRSEETETDDEGCLSLPGIYYPVERSLRVTIEGLDGSGEEVSIAAEGFRARVYQHELDHLDGILFVDRLTPELRKAALSEIRDQALGITRASTHTAEEAL